MNIGTISYWFYEAFESMKKNIKNVLISVSTMIVIMLIIAVGYAVLMNSNYIAEQKQEASSKIIAYLEKDVTEEQIYDIQTKLDSMDGVVLAKYYSTEDGMNLVPKSNLDIFTKAIEEEDLKDTFPATFVVTFNSIDAEKDIIRTLRQMDGVRKEDGDVAVSQSAEASIKSAKSVGIISKFAMVILVELSIFLMINTTKLMLYARRKEISIMKYVGAKDGFIKMPFAIEGIIITLIAVLIVLALFSLFYEPIIQAISAKASFKYLELSEFMTSLIVLLVVIAVFIGVIGSTASMSKYLDV